MDEISFYFCKFVHLLYLRLAWNSTQRLAKTDFRLLITLAPFSQSLGLQVYITSLNFIIEAISCCIFISTKFGVLLI